MNKSIIKIFFALLLVSLFLSAGQLVFASPALSGLKDAALGTGLENNSDPIAFAGKVIAGFLGLLGVMLVIVLIYAGVLWGFLAKGDPAQIKKAKEMIINAIIGLTLVFISYALTNFIITSLSGGGGGAT